MSLKHYSVVGLGLATALIIHFIGGGWWLNSGDRVRTALTLLGVMAFVIGAAWPKTTVLPALQFWIGFMAVIATILLFFSGEQNIWPIVLVIGGGMSAGAILVGFVSGLLLRKVV